LTARGPGWPDHFRLAGRIACRAATWSANASHPFGVLARKVFGFRATKVFPAVTRAAPTKPGQTRNRSNSCLMVTKPVSQRDGRD